MPGVEDFLGASAYAAMSRGQFVPALMRIEELARPADPIAVLIRLFPLACVVPAQYLDDALPALGVAGMVDLGLITPTRPPSSQASVAEQEHYRAAVDLSPYGLTDAAGSADLWVSSDLAGHQRRGVLRHDHVVGVGQASLTLAQYIVREPVERALDVGVGCGIQTFHLITARPAGCCYRYFRSGTVLRSLQPHAQCRSARPGLGAAGGEGRAAPGASDRAGGWRAL